MNDDEQQVNTCSIGPCVEFGVAGAVCAVAPCLVSSEVHRISMGDLSCNNVK